MDDNKTEEENASIGSWSEWGRLLVSRLEENTVRLDRIENKLDKTLEITNDKFNGVCNKLQVIEVNYAKLVTEFRSKIGVWGAIMSGIVLSILALVEILRSKLFGK